MAPCFSRASCSRRARAAVPAAHIAPHKIARAATHPPVTRALQTNNGLRMAGFSHPPLPPAPATHPPPKRISPPATVSATTATPTATARALLSDFLLEGSRCFMFIPTAASQLAR
jgi:hypothetical protein